MYSTLGGVDLQDVIRALHKEDRAEVVQDLQSLKHEHASRAHQPATISSAESPSPSRPADASSEFVVQRPVPLEWKVLTPTLQQWVAIATMEESVESAEDTQEEHATETSSVGKGGDEESVALAQGC